MIFSKKAFTLIELIVVILIICILASVTISTLNRVKMRVIASEAIAALSTIRVAEKEYYKRYQELVQNIPLLLGSDLSRLEGIYFGYQCYEVSLTIFPRGAFWVWCRLEANPSSAPKAGIIRSWPHTPTNAAYIMMDSRGNVYSNVIGLGYKEP